MNTSLRVGDWRIHPKLNQIQSETQTLELEPRAMEVLLYLCRHGDEVISRDDLIEQVWKGSIVSDQAINRVISLLRKALGDDAANPRYIATISKRGYRLVAAVVDEPKPESHVPFAQTFTCVQDAREQEGIALTAHLATLALLPGVEQPGVMEPFVAGQSGFQGSGLRRFRWLGYVALVMVLLLIMGTSFFERGASPSLIPQYSRAKALTSTPGNEHNPSNSPDGRYVAYSYRPRGEEEYRQIQILDTQTGQAQAMTTGRFIDDNPTWAPDGRRLAFHRRGEKTCQIMSVAMLDGRVDIDSLRELKTCHPSSPLVSIAWSKGGETLYYTDAEAVNEPMRILELDIATGKSRAITNSPDLGRGDYFVQASWQTGQLFFLRNKDWRQSEIYSLEFDSGSIQKRLSVPWLLSSLSLHPEGKSLVFRDISGLFKRLDLGSGKSDIIPAAITAGLNPVYMSNGRELLFANAPERDRNIKFLANPLRPAGVPAFRPAIDSVQRDDTPALAPSSMRLAFVSNRSGLPQIWLQERDGSLRQLSQFEQYDFIVGLQWSPNEASLLVQRGDGLSLVKLSDGSEQSLVVADKNIELPRWSVDGKALYFSSPRSGQRQLYRRELASGDETQLTRQGGYTAFPSQDGRFLYYTKYHQTGLWRMSLADGHEALVLPDISQAFPEQLALGQRGLYFVHEEGELQILKYQAVDASEAQTIASVKRGPHQRFVLSRDESLIAMEISEWIDTDLYLLTQGNTP